ncbi:MAG TPA: PadR family transcriptional regulator [Thermoanaerobaculia bacterium]|nr:PadR family transcriptional regulator [Thermoanaerobaculia bacterium]
MSRDELQLLQGTLDLLILRALSEAPMHGYGMARWIVSASGDALRIEEGSLYPALYRLEGKGWLASAWKTAESGRRARVYRLTAAGRRALGDERSQWKAFAAAVAKVLS